MKIFYQIDKNLVREAMAIGNHRTQAAAIRAALLSYIEYRLPQGQTIDSYIAALQTKLGKQKANHGQT
jgi:hypothetical protein